MDIIKIGILTASDRASMGEYEDISGMKIKEVFSEYLLNECEFVYKLCPDEKDMIEKNLISLCDEYKCDLVVTTGGTGPAPRDITPEATRAVIEKELLGFGEKMRLDSLKYAPTSILSRQTAGVRGSSLIINLPGKPKAIKECIDSVFSAIGYCLDLIGAGYMHGSDNAPAIFRPKSK